MATRKRVRPLLAKKGLTPFCPRLRGWTGGVALGLLLGTMVYAVAEDITVTTYYPSPRGVYQDLRVTSSFTVADGTEGANKIMASDADGRARWTDATDPTVPLVPAGLIALFNGPCPAGWTRFGLLDGGVPRGDTVAGGTGGGDTHTHTVTATVDIDHDHWSDPGPENTSVESTDHTHDVNISHDHSYGGTTGDSGCSSNRMGDCDNDACIIPDLNHCHGYGGTTSNEGGDLTTSGVSNMHQHVVDLPGWQVGSPQQPGGGPPKLLSNPFTVATADGDSWPPYRNMVFCQKD